MAEKNKVCPECRKGNHDKNGDHLFLMKDGKTWACDRVAYHENQKWYFESSTNTLPKQVQQKKSNEDTDLYSLTGNDAENSPSLETRGIVESTMKKYGIRCGIDSSNEIAFHFYPLMKGKDTWHWKVRKVDNKKFNITPKLGGKQVTFFGQHLFTGGKRLLITEGELDAASAYQMLSKYNVSVVSIPTGAKNLDPFRTQKKFLNNFKELYIDMDKDEEGKKALKKIASLCPDIKVLDYSGKDANEMLTEKKEAEYVNAFWKAEEYSPAELVKAVDLLPVILKQEKKGLSYPFEDLDKFTYGLHIPQIIGIGGSPGAGKTVFMDAIVRHFAMHHHMQHGVFSLEELPTYTMKKLIGGMIGSPIHIPGTPVDEGKVRQAHSKIAPYITLYDHDGDRRWDNIEESIRWQAYGGTKIFIIDPMTALVADGSASEVNEMLNKTLAKLSKLVVELKVVVFLVSHLNNAKQGKSHSEGGRVTIDQFTGSRAIPRWSHLIIGLERDQQNSDSDIKNTLYVRVLKNRITGKTGTFQLRYNQQKNRLEKPRTIF